MVILKKTYIGLSSLGEEVPRWPPNIRKNAGQRSADMQNAKQTFEFALHLRVTISDVWIMIIIYYNLYF